jgi:hypothetical protein
MTKKTIGRMSCSRSLAWLSVVVVLGMILFPQQIAGFLADRVYPK